MIHSLWCNVDASWQQRPHGMPLLKTNTAEQISLSYIAKYCQGENIIIAERYKWREKWLPEIKSWKLEARCVAYNISDYLVTKPSADVFDAETETILDPMLQ